MAQSRSVRKKDKSDISISIMILNDNNYPRKCLDGPEPVNNSRATKKIHHFWPGL